MRAYKLDGLTLDHPYYGRVTVRFERTRSGRRKQVAELFDATGKRVARFDLWREADPMIHMGFHGPGCEEVEG